MLPKYQGLTGNGAVTQKGSSCGPIPLASFSVSARAEFIGVIDDPLFESLGVIGKFRGSELFLCNNNVLVVCACINIKGI